MMRSEESGLKSIAWRYYGGSEIDFYWPWILFGLLLLAANLWLAGSFVGKPEGGPPIEAVADAGTALSIDCPGQTGAAAEPGNPEASVSLDGCALVADALVGWSMMADGRSGDVPPKSERAIGQIDRSWQESYLCSLSPSWGAFRPAIAHIVAAGVIEPCSGGRWAASLWLTRNTGLSADMAQFLTFLVALLSFAWLGWGMMRSRQTRAAFRWLYQSQHG